MANTTGKKYGGRKKGTPNRMTKESRIVLKNLVYDRLENINCDLDRLTPKERIEMLIKLLPFVLPKIESLFSPEQIVSLPEIILLPIAAVIVIACVAVSSNSLLQVTVALSHEIILNEPPVFATTVSVKVSITEAIISPIAQIPLVSS